MLAASLAVLGVQPQSWWHSESLTPPPAVASELRPQTTQLECGVLWFLHICKTGGTTVKDFLKHDVGRSDGKN